MQHRKEIYAVIVRAGASAVMTGEKKRNSHAYLSFPPLPAAMKHTFPWVTSVQDCIGFGRTIRQIGVGCDNKKENDTEVCTITVD